MLSKKQWGGKREGSGAKPRSSKGTRKKMSVTLLGSQADLLDKGVKDLGFSSRSMLVEAALDEYFKKHKIKLS
jgi:hypothetical protein